MVLRLLRTRARGQHPPRDQLKSPIAVTSRRDYRTHNCNAPFIQAIITGIGIFRPSRKSCNVIENPLQGTLCPVVT
jgi:hypothetical protein